MNKILAKSSGMSLIDHSKLVSRIAVKIAEKSSSSLDSDILESIRLGGLLHDIGKCTKEFQKKLDKTIDTDENLEAKIKFRHNEVGWSFISRYLKLSKKRVYDNVLDVIYWHHGISNQMGNYNDTSIVISDEDTLVMVNYLKGVVDESSVLEKEYKPRVAPSYYYISENSAEINVENLFIRACVISADRIGSSIIDINISDDEIGVLIDDITSRSCNVNIDSHTFFGNSRFLLQQEIVELIQKTTQVNATAGFGKTLLGLLWNFLRGKQLIWVCPRNVVAESVYKSINEELNHFGLTNLSIELYYGGEVKEHNSLFKGAFKSDIVVTNIDSCLRPTVDTSNGNMLLTILNADIVFDEYHELIGDSALFACFINIMRTRHQLTNSKTLLLSATGTCMYKLWDSFNSKTTILPSLNKHYPAPHNKKYLINITDNLSIKNKNDNNLVILNSIGNSQDYMSSLGFDVLLHSGFIDSDRSNNMSSLYKHYGKESNRNVSKPNFVGTHVVQASLDVSFNNLYESVLSPQSTLQRIGRCDRWGDILSTPSINIFNLKNKGEDKIRNILYSNNLTNTWLDLLKKYNGQELTLDELYSVYNEFEVNNLTVLNNNLVDKHDISLKALSHIYPVKFFNNKKGDNKTAGGNKLRSKGGEIFVICKYFDSDKYTDAISTNIWSSIDEDFHEHDFHNIEKRIESVMKHLRDTNDSRFDYNEIINDKKYLSLDTYRRRAIKAKTPYIRFDKVYHPVYGEINIERLNKILKK